MENNSVADIQIKLQNYMKSVRKTAQAREDYHIDDSRCMKIEKRYWNDGGVDKYRIVAFMRGSGCSHVNNNGGCTFCGFYNATKKGIRVSEKDYLLQMENLLSDWPDDVEKICCYNDGSFLAESEIKFTTVLAILKMIDANPYIKSATIEAKIEDITLDKLVQIRSVYHKDLEIAIGYESANSLVRDLCINKSFADDKFEAIIQDAIKCNVKIIPLIMIKPPFLSEREAAEDVINSLVYLERFELRRIDIELPTVEIDTLTFELWRQEKYQPLNLWTLVYILEVKEKLGLNTRVYISPMEYSVESYDTAYSCNRCMEKFKTLISLYNKTQDASVFKSNLFVCQKRWKEIFANSIDESIPARINHYLEYIQ